MKANRAYILYFWILTSLLILLKVFYSSTGYVTPDGGNYLKLAKNLTEGRGMYVSNPCNTDGREYFAKWPAAYPLLIAALSKVSGLSVFWASKILNCLLLAGSILLLAALLKSRFIFAAPVFFIDSYIGIGANSWSENLFIFGILLSVLAMKRFNYRADWKNSLLIFISILTIFLSRYAGIVVFAWLGIAALIFLLKKQFRHFIRLLISSSAALVICTLYLWVNYKLNGNPTGLNRGVPVEDFLQILSDTIWALAFEMTPIQKFYGPLLWFVSLPLAVLFSSLLLWYLYKRDFLLQLRHLQFSISDILICTGLFWWLSIILLRFNIHFDRLDYRLLGPGTILIFAGLALELESIFIHSKKILRIVALLIPLLLVTWNWISIDKTVNFNTEEKARIELYSPLPANSIVIFGEYNLIYLFDHVIPVMPGKRLKWQYENKARCKTVAVYTQKIPGCFPAEKRSLWFPDLMQYQDDFKEGQKLLRIK